MMKGELKQRRELATSCMCVYTFSDDEGINSKLCFTVKLFKIRLGKSGSPSLTV